LQTNHADFRGTGRTSAARSPDRAARNGTRRTGRHEVAGLITQRSLVQIQPAQREKLQVAGLKGGSRAKGSRLDFCPTLPKWVDEAAFFPGRWARRIIRAEELDERYPLSAGTDPRRYLQRKTSGGELVWKHRRELAAAQPVDRRPKGVPHPLRGGGGGGPLSSASVRWQAPRLSSRSQTRTCPPESGVRGNPLRGSTGGVFSPAARFLVSRKR